MGADNPVHFAGLPFRAAPRRHVQNGGALVRVSEDARKCSVFIGYGTTAEDFDAHATGFLVCVPGFATFYLVTAAHCARGLGRDPFQLRLNRTPQAGGGSDLVTIDGAEWHYHADSTVDVAVLEIDPPHWADCAVLRTDYFVDAEKLDHFKIGPGDPAYVVGLFSFSQGNAHNTPIVHSGNIALMASDERLEVRKDATGEDTESVSVHLVESSALPGASGSQVLVGPTIPFMTVDAVANLDSIAHAEGGQSLLGMWVANWPGDPDDRIAKAMRLRRGSQVPVGIGMVVPASFILDILQSPTVERKRVLAKQKRLHEKAATRNSLPRETAAKAEPEDSNPRHKEDFTRLLNAAVKGSPSEDQT
jgi:hypothetical protein